MTVHDNTSQRNIIKQIGSNHVCYVTLVLAPKVPTKPRNVLMVSGTSEAVAWRPRQPGLGPSGCGTQGNDKKGVGRAAKVRTRVANTVVAVRLWLRRDCVTLHHIA